MKTKEKYIEEKEKIKIKAMALLESQPSNLDRMRYYMSRLTYINGILKGMEVRD